MPRKAATSSDPVIVKAKPASRGSKLKVRGSKSKPAQPDKPAKPKPPSKRQAHLQKLELELIRKRRRVLELKEDGKRFREIAAMLEAEGEEGVSRSRVHQLYREGLEEAIEDEQMAFKEHLHAELRKIARQEAAILPNIYRLADLDKNLIEQLSGFLSDENVDKKYVQYLLKKGLHATDLDNYSKSLDRIWKRRDSLLGLNKPTKVEHTGQDGKPIETTVVTRVILPAAAESLPGEQEEGDAA